MVQNVMSDGNMNSSEKPLNPKLHFEMAHSNFEISMVNADLTIKKQPEQSESSPDRLPAWMNHLDRDGQVCNI